jgi:hypothetical protein
MANQQSTPADAKRNAQPTLSNSPTGVNKSLVKNPFKFDDLRFPLSVGNTERHLHWIKFIPMIQNKSEYSVKTQNVASFADTNRRAGLGAGSSNALGNDAASRTTAGLTTIIAAEGVINNAGEAVSAALGSPKDLGRFAGELAGSTISSGIGIAASAFIVSGIDLTRKTRRAAATISLYMPDTVTQQLVNDYDQVSLTQALGKAGLGAQVGSDILGGTESSVMAGLGATRGTGTGAEAAGLIAEKTGNFGAGITDVLLFSAGLALNPQVELLFKNIQNREFLFDFKFAPRNAKEAEAIREIIKKFRFFAAPEIPSNGRGRYFIPPSEFDIEFMVGPYRNTNLPRLSTCVLQGIDVNYGSAGQWTAFKDGMPVEISMQLRFKEVEIMHKKLLDEGY